MKKSYKLNDVFYPSIHKTLALIFFAQLKNLRLLISVIARDNYMPK